MSKCTINDEMQPTTLALNLNGLFDAPSKNIESAFEHVLGLITQQSREISDLRQAHNEAAVKNGDLKSQLERNEEELAKERSYVADEIRTLKKDHDALLALHRRAEATLASIQREVKVC